MLAIPIAELIIDILFSIGVTATVVSKLDEVCKNKKIRFIERAEGEEIDDSDDDSDDDNEYGEYEDLPNRERVGKQKGKAPRSNKAQNKEFEEAMRRNGINNPSVKRQIHREISKQGFGLEDLDNIANDYKN